MLMAYNQDNGDMYEFNSVGAEIFMMIAKEMSVDDMFCELTKKYNFDSIDDMLNKMYPILEWALVHEVNIREDIINDSE